MKLFSFILISALLLGCGTTKGTTETVETSETAATNSKPERNIKLTAEIGEFTESEPFQIHSVRREGNLLFIDISFTGGCGVHEFKVIGNRAIMKSMPPKRSVMISHSVPREECNDTVKKVIEIDISALAASQTPGSEINLILEGWEQEINYIFE